jgi:hypothetical protein
MLSIVNTYVTRQNVCMNTHCSHVDAMLQVDMLIALVCDPVASHHLLYIEKPQIQQWSYL